MNARFLTQSYNRRQNESRHFALNGFFDVFRTSKGEKIAFPPPSPPCNIVPLFELPLENKKHRNFEWRGQGRGVDSYVSEVTIFEYNVSTILSPIVAFPSITPSQTHQLIKAIRSGNAAGLDGVSTRLLKIAAPAVAPSLAKLINSCITSGTFPAVWIQAKVTPLHTGNSKADFSFSCSLENL